MAITSTLERAGRIADDEPTAQVVRLKDGRPVALRVAGAEDAVAVQRFVRGLSEQSRRYRFFAPVRELSLEQLERLTRSHPPDELALVGEITAETGESRIVALAQYVVCEPLDAEFAVVVDDAWQRQGLGMQLVGALAEQAARAGVTALNGFVLPDNWPMLSFLARLDCELDADSDPNLIRAVKRLEAHEAVL
ncbi:MAG TPA: GNAT family N-acetyltransferase [Burkholderiales bacterium]|nr:GNAT family N-acetyltransferase [Burkholderiales bacterium]